MAWVILLRNFDAINYNHVPIPIIFLLTEILRDFNSRAKKRHIELPI